ncbi:hypothetical protein K466DRAFT_605704 [Polyporus arcularius HHB13444]|uniref:F-box domain-containing protein n=1 Tax=Polyporus arcularius HHB13444 TaxID=1314778 RepID=A0A5C3NTU4_9APHY|nr:hypothetical protein K466DRAFT_605704 [Polyporus arcularius HHB13444]
MAMQAGASAVERVPVEVWLEIFKQVPKSTDLHSLSVASRKCCSITTRALHRDLVWDKERQAVQDLDVWQTDAGMASRVRSLVLSIGGSPANNTPAQNAFILGNYVWPSALKGLTAAAQQALLAPNKQVLFRSEQVQAVLWARVETFTNLSTLVLKDMTIRNGHFRLIHNLAQLRSLSLIGCNVDHGAADGFNNQALPITSLTMIGVRRGRGATVHAHAWHNPAFFAPVQPIPLPQLQLALAQANLPIAQILLNQGNPPPVAPDSFAQALSLAAAPTLRTLKVDSSTDVFRHVFDAPGAEDRGWVAPPMLEHLHVLQVRTITAKVRDHVEDYHSPSLYNFCSRAHRLKTISAPVFAPSDVTMDPHIDQVRGAASQSSARARTLNNALDSDQPSPVQWRLAKAAHRRRSV